MTFKKKSKKCHSFTRVYDNSKFWLFLRISWKILPRPRYRLLTIELCHKPKPQ